MAPPPQYLNTNLPKTCPKTQDGLRESGCDGNGERVCRGSPSLKLKSRPLGRASRPPVALALEEGQARFAGRGGSGGWGPVARAAALCVSKPWWLFVRIRTLVAALCVSEPWWLFGHVGLCFVWSALSVAWFSHRYTEPSLGLGSSNQPVIPIITITTYFRPGHCCHITSALCREHHVLPRCTPVGAGGTSWQ